MEGDDGSSGCLEECQRQVDAVSAEGKYSFSIFLNENGEKGYQAAWEKASAEGADFFLWIDHDLRLSEGMIACLFENSEFLRHKAVITGSVSRPDNSLLFLCHASCSTCPWPLFPGMLFRPLMLRRTFSVRTCFTMATGGNSPRLEWRGWWLQESWQSLRGRLLSLLGKIQTAP